MPDIASWNGHLFVVSSKLISSFRDLVIKGSCETKDKTTNNQKYVERKAGEAAQITFTVELNRLTGVADVYAEAMKYVTEAAGGVVDYFYLGATKAIPAKMMLVTAEVQEVVTAPKKGDTWISCTVKLTMKQASELETGGSGDGGGGGNSGGKYQCRIYYSGSSGAVQSVYAESDISYKDAYNKALAKVPSNALWFSTKKPQATNQDAAKLKDAENRAKEASEEKIPDAGLDKWTLLTEGESA